jgi:cytochrome c oxidase subunit I
VGLFWSGGYGVQRKSPDAVSSAMDHADLALRVQSSGGGLAILGGLLFLIVMLKAWRRGKNLSA